MSLLGFPKLSRAPLSLQCHLPARLNLPCPLSLPAPTAASVYSPGAPARWYTDARFLFSCPLFIVPQDSVSASLPLQAEPWADVTLLYTCPAFSAFPIKTIVIICFITSLPCTFCEIRDTSVCLVQAARERFLDRMQDVSPRCPLLSASLPRRSISALLPFPRQGTFPLKTMCSVLYIHVFSSLLVLNSNLIQMIFPNTCSLKPKLTMKEYRDENICQTTQGS